MRILDYIPHFLREVKEYQNISLAETPELNDLKNEIDFVLKNQFILTADNYGLGRWESFIDTFLTSEDDIETRRKKLLLMVVENRPYTIKSLQNLLNYVFGDGVFQLSLNKFTLNIMYSTENEVDQNLLKNFLRRTLPANILYKLNGTKDDPVNPEIPDDGGDSGGGDSGDDPVVTTGNTHSYLNSYTHAQLKSYTHGKLKEGI